VFSIGIVNGDGPLDAGGERLYIPSNIQFLGVRNAHDYLVVFTELELRQRKLSIWLSKLLYIEQSKQPTFAPSLTS